MADPVPLNEARVWSEARYRYRHDAEFAARVNVARNLIEQRANQAEDSEEIEMGEVIFATAMMAMQVSAIPLAVLMAGECPECHGEASYTVSIGMGAAGPCQTCGGPE
jgi:hypothetical protein